MGLDDEDVPQGAVGDALGDGRRGQENARAPSPPPQQLPPPNFGMDWRPPAPAAHIPADPFAFPFAPPYAPHLAFPHAPFYAAPYILPFALPYAPPFAFPYVPLHPFPFAGPPAPPPADADEGMVVAGVDGEQRVVIPQLDAETIGPLSSEQSLGFFTSEEDEESPSTSGLSSSTKRSREESDEQAAAKRPRWSDDSDSD